MFHPHADVRGREHLVQPADCIVVLDLAVLHQYRKAQRFQEVHTKQIATYSGGATASVEEGGDTAGRATSSSEATGGARTTGGGSLTATASASTSSSGTGGSQRIARHADFFVLIILNCLHVDAHLICKW